jgi:AraC-like DNA-binding protein
MATGFALRSCDRGFSGASHDALARRPNVGFGSTSMNGIQSSFYTVAIALCLFSTGIVGGRKTRTGRPCIWFTVFLALETLGFVLDLLTGHPAVPYKALWLGLRMGMSVLLAPCLWLVMQESVELASPGLASLGRWPMVIILVGMASTLPVIQSANPGTEFYHPSYRVSAAHSRIIHGTMLLCMAVFAVQGSHYLGRCRQLLLAHVRARNDVDTGGWLHLPLLIVFTTWLVGILRVIHCATHSPPELAVFMSLLDVSVAVGAMYTIARRVAASGPPAIISEPERPFAPVRPVALPVSELDRPQPSLPVEDEIRPVPEVTPGATGLPLAPTVKYARSPLPEPARERIRRKLSAAMADEALYRDCLLSLRSLSAQLHEKPHYVSQVINQELGSTFYDFVNRHRVLEAGRNLVESPEQSVLEIALAAGFSSKSTFNESFRKHFGITPRQFRAKKDRPPGV